MLDFPIQSFQFDPFKVWFNEEIFWLFLYLTYSLDPESIISLSHSFYSGLEADFSPKIHCFKSTEYCVQKYSF